MRILFLSRWFPYPPDNGSKIRIFNILRQLSAHHEISLLAFSDDAEPATDERVSALRAYCTDVQVVPYRSFQPSSARARLALLSPRPRSLVDTHSAEMQAAARRECARARCDLIVASQLDMVPYVADLPDVPAVLEELEISRFRDAIQPEKPLWSRTRSLLTWLKLAAYLRRSLPRFAACTVVSEAERDIVRSIVPGYAQVHVVPNALDLDRYRGEFGSPQPKTLVFAGSLTFDANHDAVHYFLDEIYPSIVRAVPDVAFRVTGRTGNADLRTRPDYRGVEFTGYVSDVRPIIAQSWASVVPLRLGGGTRLKILESMALGTPVISTTKGAEGLDVTDGESVLIADRPDAFARRVVELLTSPELRRRLGTAGRHLVETRYDWRIVGESLRTLAERVQAGRAA